jgi:hypothetical protein
MPTLFLAFANNDKKPLPSLRDEDSRVNGVLNDRKLKSDFMVHCDQFATTESMIRGLRTFKDDIELFLYSGHAGNNILGLEDGVAEAEGIAALLGHCPNLKLVILNGCSTSGQIESLFQKNVPIVIATSSSVDDKRATQFSIAFFEELALKRTSIRSAFESAIAAAQVTGEIKYEIRSRLIGYPDMPQTPLWGLYYQSEQSNLIDTWRLPEKPMDTNPNQYINASIDLISKNYQPFLQTQDKESSGQNVILNYLPHSISEPIRKLLAPSIASEQQFYDRPSKERFQMLLYAYRSIIAFVAFVSVSQLWEHKRLSDSVLNTDGIQEMLKNWLKNDYEGEDKRSLLSFLKELLSFMSANKIPHFLKELETVMTELNRSENRESIDYLEKLIAENPKSDLSYLCEETEKHLAIVLYQFGFLIHYGLTSVKDIKVLFYQHDETPNFEHKMVKLQRASSSLEDHLDKNKTHHKTSTILLRRLDDTARSLYLSPFFIDENAYLPAPKAKLCFFIAYDTTNKRFYFRHVSANLLNKITPIEEKKITAIDRIKMAKETTPTNQNDNYFLLIYEQFSAFCKDMFNKTLEEL